MLSLVFYDLERGFIMRLLAAVSAGVCVAAVVAPHALGQPPDRPHAVVSLGDSFISGEAGRWKGNSNAATGDRDGTDRAWVDGVGYDATTVYGTTHKYANSAGTGSAGWSGSAGGPGGADRPGSGQGCHRSDSAEVFSAFAHTRIDDNRNESLDAGTGVKGINLACSGAESPHIVDTPFKGEQPQAAQLATVASRNTVDAVVLSIGGNDLNLSGILTQCVKDWALGTRCAEQQQRVIEKRLPAMRAGVAAAITAIRSAMRSVGYSEGGYRFIVQSYPSPVPNQFRSPGDDYATAYLNGTPLHMSDMAWLHDWANQAISDGIRQVAREQNTEFLDLTQAFTGREIRSPRTSLGSDPAEAEWVRFQAGLTQGDLQESFHPNYFGQQKLGTCLKQALDNPGPEHHCTNT
ncbi:hypothetical protein GZH49_38800 [Nocardia terpenica]